MDRHFERLVIQYLEGDLDEEGAGSLARHLESDEGDRAEFAALAGQSRSLAVMHSPDSDRLVVGVLAELTAKADDAHFVRDVIERLPDVRFAPQALSESPVARTEQRSAAALRWGRRRGSKRTRRSYGPKMGLAAGLFLAAGLSLLVLGRGVPEEDTGRPARPETLQRGPQVALAPARPVSARARPAAPGPERSGPPDRRVPAEAPPARAEPAGPVRPRVASITVPEGMLQFAPAGSDRWKEARDDTGLAPGDWLRTRDAPARVVFDSGTVLYANRFTTLMLLTRETSSSPCVSMMSGEVYVETAGAGSGLAVHTPHCRAVDIGTRFDVEVRPEGTTVMVAEGFVEASTDAGAVALAAEQEVVLEDLASAPGEVRPALDIEQRLAWTKAFDGEGEPQEPGTAVASFTLMNADTNEPIAEFDPLTDGAQIELERLPTRRLNVRANVVPATVGSVRFVLSGRGATIEEQAPYSLYGDTGGDYRGWTPGEGRYTVTATPYGGFRASGRAGESLTITFRVVCYERLREADASADSHKAEDRLQRPRAATARNDE